jgi:uncharacterized protein YggE
MKRIATVFTALALSFSTLALTSTAAIAQADVQAAYIDVSGHGEIEAYPDYLTISVELSATDKDVATAKNLVDEAFAQITTIAKNLRIERKDVESVLINNYPQWQYLKNGKRELIGHRVTRPVTINLRNLDNYGKLLESLLTDERFRVSSTQLKFNDPEKYQTKARRLALLNAKEKASEMSAVLDQKISGVLWIQETGNRIHQPVMMMESASMMRSKADTGSEMQIQEQTISQQVQVRFSIIPD